jgi:hypothetical protein
VPPPATSLEKLARLPWLKKNQILSLDGYWAHLVRLLPAQGEVREKLSSDHPREPLLRYVALGVIQSRLPQLRADGGWLWDF